MREVVIGVQGLVRELPQFERNPPGASTLAVVEAVHGEVILGPRVRLEGDHAPAVAGASFVDADYSLAITGAFPTIGRRFSDDDVVFTGQVFAGIVWEATENFELYTGVRYIYVDDPEFSDTFTGSALNVELDDYLVEGGFRFNF